ncbi:hypothetical protein O181_070950 [Austropuccinia psidii MF-1]|uniref:Uncharacterized protein n=1 Tax=Austropuccinia psidii MF-1 TaxID=1389203 RepID=A0A9Q3I9K3_9BASI|nr:hypothetical protein [Austropuccinia psidii MF-1]
MLSADQQKKLAQGKDSTPVEALQASTSKNQPQPVPKSPSKPQIPIRRAIKRERERQSPSGTSLTLRIWQEL